MSSRLPHPLAPLTFIIHPSCFGQRNGGGLCVTRHGCHLALPKCWEWCLWVPGEGEEGRLSEVGRPWKPAAIAWQGSPLLLRPPGGAAGAAAAPQSCLSLLMLPGGEAALPGGAVVAYHCSCYSCFAAWRSRRLLLERRHGLGGVKGCAATAARRSSSSCGRSTPARQSGPSPLPITAAMTAQRSGLAGQPVAASAALRSSLKL